MKITSKIMGHRGAKGEEPENTLLSFRRALQAGVQAMEFDIHLSADGELVVIHDDTVERTTNGTGAVLDLRLSELRELDAGKGEKIPLLSEVIELLKPTGIDFFIEVKALQCEKPLVEIFKKYDLYEQAAVICFNHRVLQKLKSLDQRISTACLLYGLPVNPVEIVKAANADGLSLSVSVVDRQLVDECHRAGMKVTTWNVNRSMDLPKIVAMGFDYIGTDYPTEICQAFTQIRIP